MSYLRTRAEEMSRISSPVEKGGLPSACSIEYLNSGSQTRCVYMYCALLSHRRSRSTAYSEPRSLRSVKSSGYDSALDPPSTVSRSCLSEPYERRGP